jgi:cobalt-zinc-cadmium efflux system membrane fusion protein
MNRVTYMAMISAALSFSAGCSDHTTKTANASEPSHDSVTLDPSNPQRNFLKIEEVKSAEGAPSLTITGRFAYDEEHTQRVATAIDGRATSILVKLGDKVKSGQALIALSSPQVGQLQADAQKAQQDMLIAQKTVDRVHRLKVDGAVSDKEVAQAESDLLKSKSDVGRSSAQLSSIGLSASDPTVAASIRAQISGTVVERNVLVGQEVRADATTPLLTITNLDTLWVIADVYEQDLGYVTQGAAVNVRVPAYPNETFAGTVDHVGEVLDATSRTVKVRCALPNPTGRLKPEMFAKIDVADTTGKPALMIPSKAVLNDGGKSRVVVAEGNVFKVRAVDVGSESDGRVRVVNGLHAGEKIVTDGALFLKHDIDDK